MLRLAALTTLLTLLPSALAETLLTASTPSAIGPILKGAGYTPTLDKSGQNPLLTFKYRGMTISLEFIGCAGSLCKNLYISHGFDLENGLDLTTANSWNAKNLTTVYLDKDNDPWLGSTYPLTGGFSKTNLLNWLQAYFVDLQDFSDSLPAK